ncbi:MAG: hypothetical protein HYZ21_10660 [Chloroflexi bacterium]|nr:hypothetical protein [Chloroflexota bacterium]
MTYSIAEPCLVTEHVSCPSLLPDLFCILLSKSVMGLGNARVDEAGAGGERSVQIAVGLYEL